LRRGSREWRERATEALFEPLQRLLGQDRIFPTLRWLLWGWRLPRGLLGSRDWRSLPKERATEALFEPLQRLLGEERGCKAAYCVIRRRTDQLAVLFRNVRTSHRLRK
jgi:hypothetical protein